MNQVENIMLDARGHVKLIDFGLACELKASPENQQPSDAPLAHGGGQAVASQPVSPTGSLIYMAPEMIRDHTGGRHTDWWALGVLAYELLTGRTPWSSLTDKKVIRKEIQTLIVAPPRKLSPPAGQFICSLLRQDHTRRLGKRSPSVEETPEACSAKK
jgi:serine/threonine protein kinase